MRSSRGVKQLSVLSRQLSAINGWRTIVCFTVTQAKTTSNRPKIVLDSHINTGVVGDHCLVVHDHDRPINVYSYDPKDGLKHAYFVDATA